MDNNSYNNNIIVQNTNIKNITIENSRMKFDFSISCKIHIDENYNKVKRYTFY